MTMLGDIGAELLALIRNELLLFAGVGMLIGGIDDLLIDLIWAARWSWRRIAIYSRHERMTAERIRPSPTPGTMAIFIPAWDESAVIGPMLRAALHAWEGQDFVIFVGCYPNDPPTIGIVADLAAGNPHVVLAITDQPGGTTKAHCLNILWCAMQRYETAHGMRFKAVVQHDAEDLVHRDELRLFDLLIDRFAMVQLPVLPIADRRLSDWQAAIWSGHYCDEFAAAHGAALSVREALGAAMPSAGVGCAFSREILDLLAAERAGSPFDQGTLTEDYEIGMEVKRLGGRGIFVRMRDTDGALICTREFFPRTFKEAVTQKTRWTVGIALAGWDRVGWSGGPLESWMRLRDRRAPLAALVLTAGYAGAICQLGITAGEMLGIWPPHPPTDFLIALLQINAWLMAWRFICRWLWVIDHYGTMEGLLSIPRMFISNMVAIAAAYRAVLEYYRMWRGKPLHWHKTRHRFPEVGISRS